MDDSLQNITALKQRLDAIYDGYNKKIYVHPDPIEFLYNYKDPLDREVAGIIASSLAYGRVKQILKSVSFVLSALPGSPSAFLKKTSRAELDDIFASFRHRFTSGKDITSLLFGIKHAIEEYGSLEACFISCYKEKDETLNESLSLFVKKIRKLSPSCTNYLIPDPEKGSACKRPFMFLRWMVRMDEVDPGGWTSLPSSKLVIPLDTHMFAIARGLDFTRRKQANLSAALEITRSFKKIVPDDPVRYDFSLTRFGIRNDLDCSNLIRFLVT